MKITHDSDSGHHTEIFRGVCKITVKDGRMMKLEGKNWTLEGGWPGQTSGVIIIEEEKEEKK